MDNDVESKKQALESELQIAELFLQSPRGVAHLESLRAAEESLTSMAVDRDVLDIPQVFAHFTGIGHLRGLREARRLLLEVPAEIRTELKDICR